MTRKRWEEKFLDYLEDRLPDDERAALVQALADDPALQVSLRAYQRVIAAERLLAAEEAAARPGFVVSVMDQVEAEEERALIGLWRRIGRQRAAWGALAVAAAAVLVLKIGLDIPDERIGPQRAAERLEAAAPSTSLAMPAEPEADSAKSQAAAPADGLEKVAIDTEATSAVEEWAKKKEQVDVFLQKDSAVASVAQKARVLSAERRTADAPAADWSCSARTAASASSGIWSNPTDDSASSWRSSPPTVRGRANIS